MPFLILKPGEATGDIFRVKGGRYAVALFGRTAGSDIQIMMTDKSDPQAGDWARAGIVWSDDDTCLLYTSPSPRDRQKSRMPSSA